MTVPTNAPARSIGARLRDAVVRPCRGIRWYMTNLMGDNAYKTYVAHLAATHPGTTPMTEREFWRARYAEQDANPGSRCC